MKGLENRKYVEQTRLVVDNTDTDAIATCFGRIGELNRRGYKLVDKTLDGNESSYIFEKVS